MSSRPPSQARIEAPPPMSEALRRELDTVRQLCRRSRYRDAAEAADRMMDAATGFAYVEVLLTYAEYLLGRGRPYSAARALMPLLRRSDPPPEARVLLAAALADAGQLEKALELAEGLANDGTSAAVEAARLFDVLYALRQRGGVPEDLAEHTDEIGRATGFAPETLLAPGRTAQLDGQLSQRLAAGHADRLGSPGAWAWLVGELCVHHLGGTWRWRRRFEEATVRVPVQGGTVELCPALWARWRLDRPERELTELLGTLFLLTGAGDDSVRHHLGGLPEKPSSNAGRPAGHEDPLDIALIQARRQVGSPTPVTGLGLVADSPLGRLRVPLVLGEGEHEVVVLPSPGAPDEMYRQLDALSLTRWGRTPWRILDRPAGATGEMLALYESGDPCVRAALVARQVCSEAPQHNARWAATLASTCLDRNLDGSIESLSEVEHLAAEELRSGGRQRWGPLFEDRFAIIFLLTCYAGEVLRARYGGCWGRDRLTGRVTGPTAGLEAAGLRYNLGAAILKTFYLGRERPFVPGTRDFARRVGG